MKSKEVYIAKACLPVRWKLRFFSFFLFIVCWQGSFAQDVSMHTQGVMQQEFLNPAYNSFKSDISLSAYNRVQWKSEFENSPETYLVNLFMPIKAARLGVNVQGITEGLGLRRTTELKLSLCNNIQLYEGAFLSFGYSVGFLQNSFDKNKIISYPDEDLSFLLNSVEFNSLYPTASLGVLLLTRNWFLGLSSMTANIKSNMDDSQYLPGFDFSAGAILPLSSWLLFRPGFLVKYYKEKGLKVEEGVVTNYNLPTIFDFAGNFLVANRIWLGASYRVKQAYTFSADMIINNNMKVGYTYEYGVGQGLNQNSSHGIRLSYTIKGKQDTRITNNGIGSWMNHRMSAYDISSYIY